MARSQQGNPMAEFPRMTGEFTVRGNVLVRTVMALREGQHNAFWVIEGKRADVIIVRIHGASLDDPNPTRTAILCNDKITRAHPDGLGPMFAELEKAERGVWERQCPGLWDWLVIREGRQTIGALYEIREMFKRVYGYQQKRPAAPRKEESKPVVTRPTSSPVTTPQAESKKPVIPTRIPERFRNGDMLRLGCGLVLQVQLINEGQQDVAGDGHVLLTRTALKDQDKRFQTDVLLPQMDEARVNNLVLMLNSEEQRLARGKKAREWMVEEASDSLVVWTNGSRLHLEVIADMVNDRQLIDWPDGVIMSELKELAL